METPILISVDDSFLLCTVHVHTVYWQRMGLYPQMTIVLEKMVMYNRFPAKHSCCLKYA